MSLLFMWTIAEAVTRATLDTLTRRCVKCGQKQVFPQNRLTIDVACERCGAIIPPSKESKRSRS